MTWVIKDGAATPRPGFLVLTETKNKELIYTYKSILTETKNKEQIYTIGPV
jgi:hypothetical protein